MMILLASSVVNAPSLSAFDTVSAWIIVVAIGGLIAQYFQVQRYRQEKSWVQAAVFALSRTEDGQESNIGVPARSEADRRLISVSRMAEKGQSPRLSDLNDGVTLRDESSFPARISRFVVSVLLILGLAGTLYAFRHVLGDPQLFDLEGRLDMSKLSDYVNHVYAGLSHAFGASLWGIGCTAVLLFTRTVWVHSERASFYASLDDFTENELIPKFIKPPLTLPQALRETSIHMETATAKLLEVGNTLRESVTEANASAAILERFASTLLNAGVKFETLLLGGSPVEKMLMQLSEAVTRQEAILEQSQLLAKNDREDLLNAVGGVQSVGEALREWLDEIHELVADHQASTYTIKHAAETLSESSQGVFEAVKKDAENRQQLRAALNKELSTAVVKWDGAGKDIRKLIESLHTASDRHYEMITSLGRTLGNEAEKQRKATEGISTNLGSVAERLSSLPQLVSSELTPVISSVERTLNDGAAEQRKSTNDINTSLSTLAEQLSSLPQRVSSELTPVISSVERAVDDGADKQHAAHETIPASDSVSKNSNSPQIDPATPAGELPSPPIPLSFEQSEDSTVPVAS